MNVQTHPETQPGNEAFDAWAAAAIGAAEEPRRSMIALAVSVIGIGFSEKRSRARYVNLIAPAPYEAGAHDDPDPRRRPLGAAGFSQNQIDMARASGCALVGGGLWRDFIMCHQLNNEPALTVARELFATYINGRAVSNIEHIAQRASAWRSPSARVAPPPTPAGGVRFSPNDAFWPAATFAPLPVGALANAPILPADTFELGPRPGHDHNDLHIAIAVHVQPTKLPTSEKPAYLVVSVDGGQREPDPPCLQYIATKTRLWTTNDLGHWYATGDDNISRPVEGVADFDMFARALGWRE
jgi:hypothetical protein